MILENFSFSSLLRFIITFENQFYIFFAQKQQMSFFTPAKKTSTLHLHTIDSATLSVSRFQASSIDFKAKTYELMDEILQLKTKQKKHILRISELEEQVERECKFSSKILDIFNCRSKQELREKIEKIHQYDSEITKKSLKMYRKQTEQLLGRMNQMVIRYQIDALKEKKLQIDKNIQIPKDNVSKQDADESIKGQLEMLKIQMGNLLAENSNLRDKNQELQEDLSKTITKFESLERLITQKVNKYSVEIEEYQQQIQRSHQLIEKLKGEINQNHQQKQFSFCEEQHSNKGQSDEKTRNLEKNNILCYQASIDGLMDENKRLKKVLQALYRVKHGESVCEETEREINIMERIIALNSEEHV